MTLPNDSFRSNDSFGEQNLQRMQAFICLIPILGFFPSIWTLWQQSDSRDQQNASRLAIVLALSWMLGSVLLNASSAGEASPLQLLILSSLLTSGYFVVNLGLMWRLWQGKPLRLPGISAAGDRLP